jgi:hypothetical protein
MTWLYVGVGATFFAIGLVLSLSKSAKGSAVMTLLLGLVGGGSGGIVLGGGSVPLLGDPTSPDYAANLGRFLLAIGAGTALGLGVGVTVRYRARRAGLGDIEVAPAQEEVSPTDKLPPKRTP